MNNVLVGAVAPMVFIVVWTIWESTHKEPIQSWAAAWWVATAGLVLGMVIPIIGAATGKNWITWFWLSPLLCWTGVAIQIYQIRKKRRERYTQNPTN